MIEYIGIKNFKTLRDAKFNLSALNLFSGLNGMGKSSVMQTLLLLRQSYEQSVLPSKGLLLNGKLVEIGTGKDVLSYFAEDEEISFILRWQDKKNPIAFRFEYKSESDLLKLKDGNLSLDCEEESLFNDNFQYLCADRLSPRIQHSLSYFHVKDLKSLGKHGEYTVHFIAENGNNDLDIKQLKHNDATTDTLLENLELWMSDISPGIKIKARADYEHNSATLAFVFKQGTDRTSDFKPQNVGFGLSFVLPVVTSLLSAKKGDLIIIENPESHLHPAGQSLIGKLCALVAANGVQLIIETHSDHFLNGVRIAVKKELIPPDSVKLFFLSRNPADNIHEATIEYPDIDINGRIDCWPEGFFDQVDKDLDELLL